jgi:methyl-accepting chemotaxis protein
LRLRRIRKRFLLRVAIAILCNVLLCVALSHAQELLLISSWRRIATILAFLNFVPLLIFEWVNWRMVRSGVSEMWAFGQHDDFDQVSKVLAAQSSATRFAVADMQESKPYIDVIHEQIGGSLNESEREVTALIVQLNLLSAQSSHQMERITQSVQSGKALTEVTRTRVEGNNQLISNLGEKLSEQDREMRQNFEQIRMLADDVRALTPIIEVITCIAKKTSLLAERSD